jgi:hypothetical protein
VSWLQKILLKLGPPPAVRLLQMATGGWTAQALHAAARLGLADRLTSGARTVDELARELDVHERSLHRLLRALSTLGVVSEDAPGRFSLTPLGEPLRRDAPDSIHSGVLLFGEEFYRAAWGELEGAVRTGESAFRRAHGEDLFTHFERHPERGALFHRWMGEVSRLSEAEVLRCCDFSRFRRVVDVGGGRGGLLAAILARHPELRGVLFDRPEVVAGADAPAAAGVADRVQTVGGSFFDAIPRGADAYLMKIVLHDWDDPSAVRILRACREAMGEDARLIVLETVLPEDGRRHPGKILDLEMLVLNGQGRDRTLQEYRDLLAQADLRIEKVTRTRSTLSVLEAAPVPAGNASAPAEQPDGQ